VNQPVAPPAQSAPKQFLTLDDLGPGGLESILALTARLKREPDRFRGALAGGRMGMIFHKPSTRTRMSFEAAAWHLGMLPIALRPDELQLGHGETVADTARALSLYVDALAVRTFAQATLDELASHATIPIINALTDEHHPCQALADVMTIREALGDIRRVTVAFVGDGDNVCHSLIQAAALAGFALTIATPPGYEPDLGILGEAQAIALQTGGRIDLLHEPREAVRGAQVVYADVWTSMGKEAERSQRRAAFRGFTVDAALMADADKDAIFLHCLPAHRGEEVTDEVIDGPHSRVWPQAANRLHTEEALLYAMLTGDWSAERLG
jgi:ornithine carbamoyltransferase